jgi:hypothetical protein
MNKARLLTVLGLVLVAGAVVISCANLQSRTQNSDATALVRPTEASPFTIVNDGKVAEVDWEYPVVPRVWYPGDGPLGAHPYNYYAVRCWPGCHYPNSAPRPQHY